ncbi:50S ribosomal protein L23 [Candidatus Clavichlamydia salmonicola]|uniref:50S ribosomal protein L23 n=1 Tax=Candidatus Clavichlamydia salmonicola TaxID=469812 RepID=UPI00189155E3|nr:50S ribosomal protein L23 [Candidatus Clavichlamydia salmonicola]MBF5050749.1 50S ribosomal protein L23 [Candidatus Clavichlamydia salmonicola]
MKNPYDIIKSLYVTEKAKVLESLSEDRPGKKKGALSKFKKYVFRVHPSSSKPEIAHAIEAIYKSEGVLVEKVNTIVAKPKPKKARKGRPGFSAGFKKAVVTLKSGSI